MFDVRTPNSTAVFAPSAGGCGCVNISKTTTIKG